MIVSFSGIDGSGKTTQAQFVSKLLQFHGLEVHCLHMIQWTLVNRLSPFLRSDRIPHARHSRACSKGNVFILVRQFVSFLDILRFRVFGAYHSGLRRRVIVCDRFFHDLGVQALYTGMMSKRFESLYWRAVPSATIMILLDVPPEIAQQREGEHDLPYYETKRELYLERAKSWGALVVSALERDETEQRVAQIIRDYLERNIG